MVGFESWCKVGGRLTRGGGKEDETIVTEDPQVNLIDAGSWVVI